MYTNVLANRRLFNLSVVLVMFLSSSTSLGSALASTATGNPRDCTWADNPPTIWQEIMCRPSTNVGNSAGINPGDPNSPAPAIATSSVPWSVQVGTTGTQINDIATDSIGNAYVTGVIYSADDSDAFVAKLDSDGNTIWFYSFSGCVNDEGHGITLDVEGSIYITGSAQNTSDTHDILLAKLTGDGFLLWRIFWGNPTQQDYGYDIAVDELTNIYVTGGSFGSWGSPIQPYTEGQYDAFVAKFSPSFGNLVWNTFLGADVNGIGTGLVIDSNWNVYITGVNFIPGSTSDAFVTGLNLNGGQLWYTTLGSAEVNDSGRDIALDATGNIYVVGESWATWGSPISAFSGEEDAFVVKMGNDGSLHWNTFIGGTGWDLGYGIDLDNFGNIFIAGYSTTMWGNPFDSGTGTPQEVFVAKLDNNGSLQWNTFIIGEAWYQSYGHLNRIAEQNGHVYIASNIDIFESALAYVTKISSGPLCSGSGTLLSLIAQAVLDEVGEQEYCGNQYGGLITLPPGQNAFERFADLAATADYEVDFVTMGWDPYDSEKGDSPGRLFLQGIQTLYEAVKANPENYSGGVRVRILLGLKFYQFTGCQDQRLIVMNDLHQLGLDVPIPNWTVEVATYHGANQDGCAVDQLFNGVHSHVKMMIVDGKSVITGGYNMHYNYLGANPVHDMGVKVNGPIASHTLLIFDHLWLGAHLCEGNNCSEESIIATIYHDPEVVSPISAGNDVAFSLFRDDAHKTADNAIAVAIEAANSKVNLIQAHFINPSKFLPPQYAAAILNALSNEEVQVNLLLSGGDIKETAISANGVCNLYSQLLNLHPLNLLHLDVRFSKLGKPIHTKALSIDDTFIIVGSQNFDGSAWGNDNFDLDLAEYSLGIDSVDAAGDFNTKFRTEWNDAYPFFCINLPGSPVFSLQDAVDQSASGTIIYIPAGVYTESITINKPLTLIGAGANQTIIEPEGNEPAFRVTSNNVEIMNLKLSGGSGYGIELVNGSSSGLDSIQINRVVFENNVSGGVLIQSLVPGSPMNYVIENNTFIGGADGIAINMIETQAETSLIRNNIFFDQAVVSIHVLSTDDSRVEYSYNLFAECGAGICASNWHLGNIGVSSNEHDNLFDANPQFVSTEHGAYQLSAGSPAIDAGDPESSSDTYYDGNNDGLVRIDFGAIEYVPGGNVHPVINTIENQTVEVGASVTVNASYSDSDDPENHSARIYWGDGTVEDVPTNLTGAGAGEVSGQHIYDSPGNYQVEICVVDPRGGIGCDTINMEVSVSIAPTVQSITRASANPSNAENVDFTVTFSETVTGADITDFALTTSGVSGASISGISGSGTTYLVTANTGSGNGTIRLDVSASATIVDLAGNPLSGLPFTSGETYTINKNVAPTDISLSNNNVAENQPSGTTVGTLATTDPNVEDTHTYTFCGGVNDTSFTIVGNLLNTATIFDYEAMNSYSICIRATDSGGLTFDKNFAISITNVNEAPIITSDGGSSTANLAVVENTVGVTTVTATDPDAGTTLTYSISDSADMARFSINPSTGVLTFVSAPNFESPNDAGANNVYDVTVQISDGALTDTQAIAVTVTNVNEAPVNLSLSNVNVTENLPADTVIGTLTTTDPDAGDTHTYSFCGGADDGSFSISENTLSTAAMFNFEVKPAYDICIQTNDAHGGTLDINFTINVVDVPGMELITPFANEALHHTKPNLLCSNPESIPPNTSISHQIQVSRNSTFTILVLDNSSNNCSYSYKNSALLANTTYYWRAHSVFVSSYGQTYSPWSEIRTFTTGNPPSTPVLAAPADGALVAGPSPLFNWVNSTVPAGVTFDHYQIQIATEAAFTGIIHQHDIAGLTNSQDNDAVLTPATTYYWRVRAFAANGDYSDWSAVRSVKIKFDAPILLLPLNGDTVSSLRPTLTWDAVIGATSYTIQVSFSNTFGTLLINQEVATPTFTATTNALPGRTYYWRVRVNGPYGPSAWSAVFSFTTP